MWHLPPNHVRFYEDGPDWPETPLRQAAERAYRKAFLAAAREAARRQKVDELALLKAWRERREVRRKAEVLIPSSVLYNRPDFDSEQVIYHKDHVVDAARTRGRVHGLEFVRQCWDELARVGVDPKVIGPEILTLWVEHVGEWVAQDIHAEHLIAPPRPDEDLTERQRHMLDKAKRLGGTGFPVCFPASLGVGSAYHGLCERPRRRPTMHGLPLGCDLSYEPPTRARVARNVFPSVFYGEPVEQISRAGSRGFHRQTGSAKHEYILDLDNIEPYVPGEFYRRELPCLLEILEKLPERPEGILVDGYVWLDAEGRKGLGGYLFAALDETVPIIGVAKTRFAAATTAIEVFRGSSQRPLLVTAVEFTEDYGETSRLLLKHARNATLRNALQGHLH